MSEHLLPDAKLSSTEPAAAQLPRLECCDECVGSGGWYRYEPALEPAPGLLYLSCLRCRGSGRTAAGSA